MKELNVNEIEHVSGAWGVSEHTTLQVGLIGLGYGLAVAGFSLTPIGAAVLIGTSIASTVSYVSFSGRTRYTRHETTTSSNES